MLKCPRVYVIWPPLSRPATAEESLFEQPILVPGGPSLVKILEPFVAAGEFRLRVVLAIVFVTVGNWRYHTRVIGIAKWYAMNLRTLDCGDSSPALYCFAARTA